MSSCAPPPRREATRLVGGRTTQARGGEVAAPTRGAPAPGPTGGRIVRVALAEHVSAARVSTVGASTVVDPEAGAVVASGASGAVWTVERSGDAVRLIGPSGGTSWKRGALILRAAPGGLVVHEGKRYRGELWLHAIGSGGVTVVDRLPAEEYLRGVVPLELEGEGPADHAAVEAQAVAARSYTYSRLAEFLPRAAAVSRARAAFDVRATVSDQLYGGAGVERAAADRAILATRGLVLRYDGMVVSAPYHSACGGSTAAPDELWGADRAPYLRQVSDRVPGSDRSYCDAAPRFQWTRSWDGAELDAVLARYLRRYAGASSAPATDENGGVGGTSVGGARAIDVMSRTPSGRNGAVAVRTDGGRYVLRGNAIRFVLRSRGGDILPSTYFSATTEGDGSGHVARLVLRGNGNGHGVGMCQWGAMGRSRAGQDFRTILRTYFPGTTVESVD